MNLKSVLVIALVIASFLGCRRVDERSVTLEIPGLTSANQAEVVRALSKYHGVRTESLAFDLERKTLTLKYDSMQVAQTNLRMAIQDKGIEVKFPENKNGLK